MVPSHRQPVSVAETGAFEEPSSKVNGEQDRSSAMFQGCPVWGFPDALGPASTSATLPDWNMSGSSTDSLPYLKDLDPTTPMTPRDALVEFYLFGRSPSDSELRNVQKLENHARLFHAEQKNQLLQAELDLEREKVLCMCEKLQASEACARTVMEQLQVVKQQLQERTEECMSLRMALRGDHEPVIMKSIRDGQGEPWRPGGFRFVKTLERAPRNEGVVELMELSGGGQVAVKRMPISRTSYGYKTFLRDHAGETENPWVDVGIVKYLNKVGYPYACRLLGVFQDSSETFIVSSSATEGDLFYWNSHCLAQPGYEREGLIRPIIKQTALAISALHDLGIAHCDISVENILLTRENNAQLAVRLVDFSMAVVDKRSLIEPRGKAAYQAPEVHLSLPCSPFLYDLFALGVVTFVVAMKGVPWMSTRPGGCNKFECVRQHGFRAYLKRFTLGVFDPTFIDLLETTLAFDQAQRGDLAHFCSSEWMTKSEQ